MSSTDGNSSSPFHLRPAVPTDVPKILELIRGLAEFEKLAHEVVATEESLHATLFGERPYAEVVMAEEEGTVQGLALFFHNYSTFLARPGIYLEDLYVRPEARGRSLGQILLAHLAKLALDRGCGRLDWCVLNWNEGAIRFYERLGAEAMDTWTTYRLSGEALAELASEA